MAKQQGDKFVVEFFYDVISPYSYLGFEQLVRMEEDEWRGVVSVVLRPFFLGAVMQATDNKPPASVAAKARYMGRDLNRHSRVLGLRLRVPSRFPVMTLLAQRVLVALDRQDHAAGLPDQRRLRAATKRLWQIYWEEDGDPNDVPTITGALITAGCTEQEAAHLLQQAQGFFTRSSSLNSMCGAVTRLT
jgi:glutathione S-transferase kappa 1